LFDRIKTRTVNALTVSLCAQGPEAAEIGSVLYFSRPAVCLLLLGLFFDSEDGVYFSETWETSTRLHGVMSQKMALFQGPAVRTPDFTNSVLFYF
jgi:hypothetical protein